MIDATLEHGSMEYMAALRANRKPGWQQRIRESNLAKDPLYYQKIGSLGGRAPTTKPKGFAISREHAQYAGMKGGTISRRGKGGSYNPMTPKQKARALRKLRKNDIYQHLLKVHEAGKRERELQRDQV